MVLSTTTTITTNRQRATKGGTTLVHTSQANVHDSSAISTYAANTAPNTVRAIRCRQDSTGSGGKATKVRRTPATMRRKKSTRATTVKPQPLQLAFHVGSNLTRKKDTA